MRIVVDDDGLQEQTWRRDVVVTADEFGNVRDEFTLPSWFVATYQVTATGELSGTATTTFTDNLDATSGGVNGGSSVTIGPGLFEFAPAHLTVTQTASSPQGRKAPAEPLEEQIWALVSEVLLKPERLNRGLRKMVEKERSVLRGNPEEEAKTWAKRLAEVERKRSSFQDMAAEGLITLEELRAKLNSLEETRKVARTELDALASRSERVAAIERDAEAVLRDYAGLMPEALATMAPEDRHSVYKMLRLKVLVYPDGTGELRGMFGQGDSVGPLGITSRSSSGSTHEATGRCGGR